MNKIKEINSIKDEKIVYIDIIRIIACFMVIINHTDGFIMEKNSFINSTYFCITLALCKIGVPLFLMITGTLILDKNYNYQKILKNIFRVAFPVFGISLLLYIKDVGLSHFNFIYFIKSILKQPYIIPYWYIYALIGIYLAIPFLQKMIKSFKKSDYVLFIIFFLLIPSFFNGITSYFNFSINSNISSSFFPFLVAFTVCGNYLSKMTISKNKFIISICTFLISYVLMFLSLYLPYLNNNNISYTLDSYASFPVIIMSISTFIIIKYLSNNNMSNKSTKILDAVASTTFGIYLIHTFLNNELFELEIIKMLFNFNSIFGIIILDILVFILSMVIVLILKKIPIIKQFL